MRKNIKSKIAIAPGNAFYHLDCDKSEATRLSEVLKSYGGEFQKIFQTFDVLVHMTTFLTTDELVKLGWLSTALLYYRYELFSNRTDLMSLSARNTIHRFRFNNLELSIKPDDFKFMPAMQNNKIHAIAMSPCDNFIAITYSHERDEVVIFNYNTGMKTHWCGVRSPIAFSPDSKKIVACCSSNEGIYVFDVSSVGSYGNRPTHLFSDDSSWRYISSLAYLNNKNIVSIGGNGTIKLWDSETRKCIRTLRPAIKGYENTWFNASIQCIGDQYIATSLDNLIQGFDINTHECLWAIKTPGCHAYGIAITPDKKYLVAGIDNGSFGIWNFQTKQQLRTFRAYDSYMIENPGNDSVSRMEVDILGIVISNDSKYFISVAKYQSPKVFEIKTGKLICEKKLESEPTTFANVGEKIVIGFLDGSIQLFSFASLVRDLSPEVDLSNDRASSSNNTARAVPEEMQQENIAPCCYAAM